VQSNVNKEAANLEVQGMQFFHPDRLKLKVQVYLNRFMYLDKSCHSLSPGVLATVD
jgi:hypothetical protein